MSAYLGLILSTLASYKTDFPNHSLQTQLNQPSITLNTWYTVKHLRVIQDDQKTLLYYIVSLHCSVGLEGRTEASV